MKTHKIGPNYPKVANVHHVDAPDPYTVVVCENTTNVWSLQWIGSIPIIPKHKWQTITNPSVSSPEPTMTGSGPFKFVEYVPDNHVLLTAYSLLGDVNHDGTVNAQDLTELSNAYGSNPGTQHWNPACDFNSDNKVDAMDSFILGKNYGKEQR
jgi:ABC-type transport system substrate-binding protein